MAFDGLKQPPSLECYSTLKITPLANSNDIESAYHRLISQYHPEWNINPEGPRRYQLMKDIYEYLNNEACRQGYEKHVVAACNCNCLRLTMKHYQLQRIEAQRQGRAPHDNEGTDVNQRSRGPDANMSSEGAICKEIDALKYGIFSLVRELREPWIPFIRYQCDKALWYMENQQLRGNLHDSTVTINKLSSSVGSFVTTNRGLTRQSRLKTTKAGKLEAEVHSLRQEAAEAEALKTENKGLKDENKDLKEEVNRLNQQLVTILNREVELRTELNLKILGLPEQQSHGGVNGAAMASRSSIEATRAESVPTEFKRSMQGSPEMGDPARSPTPNERLRPSGDVNPGLATSLSDLEDGPRLGAEPSLAHYAPRSTIGATRTGLRLRQLRSMKRSPEMNSQAGSRTTKRPRASEYMDGYSSTPPSDLKDGARPRTNPSLKQHKSRWSQSSRKPTHNQDKIDGGPTSKSSGPNGY